jgi:hypothetical protein
MSIPQPSVEQYTLELDAEETVHAVLDAGLRGEDAWALAAVLRAATDGPPVFAVAAEITAGASAGSGIGDVDAAAFVPVTESTVDSVLAALAAGGLSVVRSVWRDRPGQAYLSDGRIFTAVRVLRPFILLTRGDDGRWIRFPADPGMQEEDLATPHTAADTAPGSDLDPVSASTSASARVGVVPAGWYLVAEVGDLWPSLMGVTGIDTSTVAWSVDVSCPGAVAERLTSWLVELEGFGASRCDARCNGCGDRWYAEAGSWHFTPDPEVDAVAWDFDDADGFEPDGTICCPDCRCGRVGFSIT